MVCDSLTAWQLCDEGSWQGRDQARELYKDLQPGAGSLLQWPMECYFDSQRAHLSARQRRRFRGKPCVPCHRHQLGTSLLMKGPL